MGRWRLGRLCAREESGAVIILFALLLIPIAGLMAGAIDFARQLEAKQEMQEALDSSALAAAKYVQANATTDAAGMAAVEEQAKAIGAQIFRANFSPSIGLLAPEPTFTFVGDRVAASADVEFEAAFLGILGISKLGASGFTEAVVPSRMDAEIAMVLDYSGSMRDNDKYKRMAEAAKGFITRIKGGGLSRTFVGLVPFSDFVRVEMKGRHIKDVPLLYFDQTMSVCLSNRSYPHSTTDETPSAAIGETRWMGVGLPAGTIQGLLDLATDLTLGGRISVGLQDALPDKGDGKKEPLAYVLPACEDMAKNHLLVRDLTNNHQELIDDIGLMKPSKYTNIALGAETGWHLLSSNEPYTAGAPPSSKTIKKVLILLTDGMQTIPAEGPSGTSLDSANGAIAEVCTNMAAADIHVFTIAYDLEDAFTRNLLKGCASKPTYFFEPGVNSDLSAVFDQIYDSIAESVRLVQ